MSNVSIYNYWDQKDKSNYSGSIAGYCAGSAKILKCASKNGTLEGKKSIASSRIGRPHRNIRTPDKPKR